MEEEKGLFLMDGDYIEMCIICELWHHRGSKSGNPQKLDLAIKNTVSASDGW